MNILRIFLSLCQSPLFNQHDVFTSSTPINITLTVKPTTSNSYFITTFIILIFIPIKQPVVLVTLSLYFITILSSSHLFLQTHTSFCEQENIAKIVFVNVDQDLELYCLWYTDHYSEFQYNVRAVHLILKHKMY